MKQNQPQIISVTGTKGKSSVVQLIGSVFDMLEPIVLRVDTTGAYMKAERIADVAESIRLFGYGTAVAPGKYMLLVQQDTNWSGRAILECSIGCSSHGLGYKKHDIGVFTNIYSDHIGKNFKTREDLAKAKSFIAKKVKDGGSLVYNADEPLIETIARKEAERINLVSISLHRPATWTADDSHIYFHDQPVVALADLPWLLDSSNTPYVYNALFVAGALQAAGVATTDIARLLPQASLDASTGRLELLGKPEGVRILLTFAHEEASLRDIARLARQLAKGKRCLASIRILHRPPERVKEFARACMEFDDLVIYEKTLPYESRHPEPKGPGLQRAFSELGRQVDYIADEKQALQTLVAKAAPGDIVVHIVNGMAEQSREIALDVLTLS